MLYLCSVSNNNLKFKIMQITLKLNLKNILIGMVVGFIAYTLIAVSIELFSDLNALNRAY